MKRLLFLSISAVLLTSGCATIEDFNYRNVNRARASHAWKSARACLPKQCVNCDYEDGFKEGYFAVATGSGSCPPVVPPPKYFHARYQSCEGQTHVNQWYQGYQAGTIAADRHGRSLWAEVPTQDGPGCSCAPTIMTTDTYHTDVIEVPSENVQVQP
jgi:hypothetical protein